MIDIGMHPFQSDTLAPVDGVDLSGMDRSGDHYGTWSNSPA